MNIYKKNNAGFTMIEVMIAVALLATIVSLTWGTLSTSFKIRKTTLDRFDRYRAVQQALDRMTREISMAFTSNIGQRPMNDQNETTYKTIFEGTDDELSFTSFSHMRMLESDPAGDQTELTYRLERMRAEDGDMHQNLIRRQDAPIDGEPDEGGIKYTMLEDCENVRFEYWDPTNEIGNDAWVRQWDVADHEGVLPSRVRITVEIEHPTIRNRTITFATQTEIMLVDAILILPPSIFEDIQSLNEAAQVIDQNDGDGR